MIGIFNPFVKLLSRKRNFVLPRWAILSSLTQLAILKRIGSANKSVNIKLGKYQIHGNNYGLLSFLIKEKFVDEEYYFTTKAISPVIIDCGANIGVSALYFKCLYPNAIIHCFEPHPVAFQLLQQNITDNKLGNVFLYEKALSDVEGTLSLHLSTSNELINSSIVVNSESGGHTMVKSTKLSQFLENFDRVDLIKIDVEGAETEIIVDLVKNTVLNSGKIKEFIIEYHYNKQKDPAAFNQFIDSFRKNGYTVSSKILYPEQEESDLIVTAII
jgi:FkbM family methyltransferase